MVNCKRGTNQIEITQKGSHNCIRDEGKTKSVASGSPRARDESLVWRRNCRKRTANPVAEEEDN